MASSRPVATSRFVCRACAVAVALCLGAPIAAAPTPPQAAGPLDEAKQLTARAEELRTSGQYDEALPLAERALALRETALGPEDLAVADALHLVALLLDDRHDYARAEAPNLRALAIREKTLGRDHPDVARSLFNLAWLAKVRQDFPAAESLYARTLDIQERALGPDHRDVAATLNDMAVLYNQKGEHDRAAELNRRVLALRERTLGLEHPGVATSLNNLARTYELKADYAEAESALQRALAIREKSSGPDHPETAFVLDGLARIASINGNFTAAEPLFLRALAIREKRLGPDHTEVATTLNNLAALYRQMGDNARAEPLLLRDMAITEKALGPNHAFLAPTLTNLAGVYAAQGDAAKAEAAFRRALSIQERALGPTHSSVATTLNRLGEFLLQSRGADLDAEPLFERALGILQQAFGPDHPAVASSLNGLAAIALRRGDRDRAEAGYQRALDIRERALGPDHPDVADSLQQLAALARLHDTRRAIALLSRAHDIRERHLDHNLPLGSERQKLGYLRLFVDDIDEALTLVRLAPDDAEAIALAVTTTLRRKGRALDATADSTALLRARASESDRVRFDRLAAARSQLAAWALRGPAGLATPVYRARLQRLEAAVEQLEADLGAQSAAFRAGSRPVTLDAIMAAVPETAALVEFAAYRPFDTPGERRPRYAAFVLTARGGIAWADLGDAAAIDAGVRAWRAALADPRRTDARTLARTLDARLMAPVRALLGAERRLLIAPDGPLNLIPFGALLDEHDRYLLERYSISYLTSGRDLLRLQVPRDSRGAPVVVAPPAYGDPPIVSGAAAARQVKTAGSPSPLPRVDDSQVFFGPLPGVADEVRALRTLLPAARFLVREEATEAALRRLSGPRLLHIATHGFFLDADTPPAPAAGPPAPGATRVGKWAAWVENPLLRSGLALAGANQGRSGTDDGVLTALEAAGLDLWGTKLVGLSACDTGIGDVKAGDGVYGLRRALVIAGAETQVMSLWPVSDRSTRDLMVNYYSALVRGQGRGDGLRDAQLKTLRDHTHAHPYYWAGFVQSGEWAALDGRR